MILQEGLCYNLPREPARRLMQPHPTVQGVGPYAAPAPAGSKVEKIPPQPDPEDVKENVYLDEADDLLDVE
jgi:hypothetical protein